MEQPHCSMNFHRFTIPNLEIFAGGVKTGIYTNDPPFTSPPLTEAAFDTLIENYHHTYEEYKNGGKLKKPFFTAAKAALIAGLDSTAEFVDNLPGVDDSIIQMGGFTPVKTVDSASVIPAQPVISKLVRGESYQVIAECNLVDGAEYYGCIMVEAGPVVNIELTNGKLIFENMPQTFGIDINKERKKIFNNLQAGVTYTVYYYAGNTAGVSNLSLPQSVMAAS